ncbi:MAG: YceD family protein [Granulosicoccus sp.]
MVKALPQRFNPDLLARDSTRFELVLPQKQMNRLGEILSTTEHDIHCTAMFSRRKNLVLIKGRIKTIFTLECQRCLEPMDVDIDEPYELVFVENEEKAESLAKQLDPVILDEHGHIHVVDLFEDEVILHVPDIPRHAEASTCNVVKTEFGTLPADTEEGKPNPFDVLKNLQLH